MKKQLYVFGMNYNPVERIDECEVTEIRIPANTEEEAKERLRAMIGTVMAKRFYLNDIRDY